MTNHLAAHHFDGDRDELLAGYDRLVASYPPEILDLNVCIVREGGISVFDSCPSREVFVEFSQSPEFAQAVAAAGLPRPRIEAIGEIHATHVRESLPR
jgi:hypothetical protein